MSMSLSSIGRVMVASDACRFRAGSSTETTLNQPSPTMTTSA